MNLCPPFLMSTNDTRLTFMFNISLLDCNSTYCQLCQEFLTVWKRMNITKGSCLEKCKPFASQLLLMSHLQFFQILSQNPLFWQSTKKYPNCSSLRLLLLRIAYKIGPFRPQRHQRDLENGTSFELVLACPSKIHTMFENHRKSLIQHCERSELRLHFEWTKVH